MKIRTVSLTLIVLLATGCVVPIVTPDFSVLTPSPVIPVLPVGTPTPIPTPKTVVIIDESVASEMEFARGAYAFCLDLMGNIGYTTEQSIVICRGIIQESLDSGAYDLNYPGWQWPINQIQGMSG